jgi:hypothetical protein
MKFVRCFSVALTFLMAVAPAVAATGVRFATPVEYGSSGKAANSVVSTDLNGDGFPDVVAVNYDGVAVLINNGDGTFAAPVIYATGGVRSFSAAIEDVNGDGNLDIVVTNMCLDSTCNNGGVGVLLGNGDGTFNSPVSYNAGGPETSAIVIGDINGDGFPDLIVTANCQVVTCASGAIYWLQGNGDGTFKAPVAITSSPGGPLAIGDLNHDGKLDLVASVGVLLGNGDGTFTELGSSGTPGAVGYIPGGATAIALADLNGDGKLDVVVAVSTGVKVQLGNGDGTLHNPVHFASGGQWALSVTAADVNGDGKLDLVVSNECTQVLKGVCSGQGKVGVLSGNGDGTFAVAASLASGGAFITSATVNDVDQDTRPDILVSNACFNDQDCTQGAVAVLQNTYLAPSVVALMSSISPSLVNQSVTFKATVTSSIAIPDGSNVEFFNGSIDLGPGSTTAGVATLTTSFAKAGSYTINAVYSGDVYHAGNSGHLKQVVNLYASTTTVMSSPNPSTFKQAVTLTATVTSGAPGGPTGTVTFKNGTTLLATKTLSGGVATLTLTSLPVGTLTINASYNGDTQSAKSSGSTTQTVN